MSEYAVVGKGLPRVDGFSKVTGQAQYTVDVALPHMLHGKILRSPHPHALIVSIDTSRAEWLPGVRLCLTGGDLADVRYAFVDTPRYPADETPLAIDKVRYVGDEVAAVVAMDEETALEALELIKVEYELLPAVFTPEESMRPDAPIIHDEQVGSGSIWEAWGAKATATSVSDYEYPNLSGKTAFDLGDIEEGFRQADHIRQDRFETNAVVHAAMEPHCMVASWDAQAAKMNCWLSSMSVFYKRFVLARALGLQTSQVRILKTYVGGAFGGKIDLFPYEFLAAYASRVLHRPVRFELSREEVFVTTRQRHPVIVELKTGVTRDGRIVAQDVRFIADNGGYRGSGAIVAFLGHQFNLPIYDIPNYRYRGYAVYTNNPIRGPQRGHGAPQTRFAIDSQIDMIAHDLGLDPAQVMLKNVRHKGDVLPNGDRLNSCGITECIEGATSRLGWAEKRTGAGLYQGWHAPYPTVRRGVGISICSMFSGSPYYPFASAAVVQMHDDGRATLFTGATEMGQGCETTLAQCAAEELGTNLEDIMVTSGDTELCPIDMGSFLGGGALVTGEAVRRAAEDAKRQLFAVAAEMLEAAPEDLEARDKRIYVRGSPELALSFAQVILTSVKKHGGNPIIGRGNRNIVPGVDNYPSLAKAKTRYTDAYGFACSVAEVEVDTCSGDVRVLKVATYHDCGYPLNRQIVEGQVDGCVSMGVGQAVSEDVILEDGRQLNASFLGYKLPIATDPTEMLDGLVESIEPMGPFGAKEVGEGAVAGVLGAVANAVYDAVGVRINSLPITAVKVLRGLIERDVPTKNAHCKR